ncbi:MAG: PAS domain-containing protein [Anaerolineae bacterium]
MEDEAKTREELLEEVRRLRTALASATAGPTRHADAGRQLLEAVIEHAPAPVYVYGVDRRLRFANPAWEKLTGLDRREAIGRSLDDIYPADVVQALVAVNRLVAASAMPLNAEEVIATRTGRYTFQSVKLPLLDAAGEVEAIGGIAIDVTARKRTEEELRHARDALQAIIGAAPLAVIATDTNGAISVWNPAAERIFGWKAAEVIGQPPPHIPEHKLEERRLIVARLAAGEPFLTLETERRHRDGSIVSVSLSIAPLDNSGGQAIGSVTILEDISRRKQTEEDLVEAYRREQMLGEYGRSFVVRYSLDPRPMIQYVSPSCLAITGYSQAEFLANPALFYERVLPEDQIASLAAHGGRHPLAYRPMLLRWLTKSGEVIWLERRDVTLRDNSATIAEMIVQDVTQRMHTEEVDQGAPARRASLPGTDPVVLLRLRLQDGPRLTWVSDSVKAATGFAAASFTGDDSFWLERVHPAERDQVFDSLNPATTPQPRTVRFGWRCADETYRWFEARRLLQPPVEHAADEIVVALAPAGSTEQAAAQHRSVAVGSGHHAAKSHWKRVVVRLPAVHAVATTKPEACPKCASPQIVRHDRQIRRIDGGRAEVEVVRYRCRACGANLTWRPAGVDRTLQGEALRDLTQVLYGLGLSKRQVSAVLANAGVRLSAGTVWRNARGAGERMRQSLPAGSRCLLPQDPTPAGVDFTVLDKLEVAGPGVPHTTLALLLWDQSGEVLAWLQNHLRALGLECDVMNH